MCAFLQSRLIKRIDGKLFLQKYDLEKIGSEIIEKVFCWACF